MSHSINRVRPCHGSGGYSPERPVFVPGSVDVGFVNDVALGQVLSPISFIFLC
jgi:hypothetical protein